MDIATFSAICGARSQETVAENVTICFYPAILQPLHIYGNEAQDLIGFCAS